MRVAIVSVLVFLAFSLPGLACPDQMRVPSHAEVTTGAELWSPRVISVKAGGRFGLARCGFGHLGFVTGRARAAPDAAVTVTGLARYDRLHLRANADCDTVLLLRAPDGRWFFDDDSGTGHTASLSLSEPPDGRYLIWVGTYGVASCPARLTLETF